MDSGGALRVGPRSAGAVPGPAAYGRGGRDLTVTDCDLLSGLLGDTLLGGEVQMDREAAASALSRLTKALGSTTEEALLGVRRVVHSNMLRATSLHLARRGLDPREFSMMAFGGAGPVHAAFLADELGVRNVVVPFFPGHFSAYGVLISDRRLDYAITIMKPWDASSDAVARARELLMGRAKDELKLQSVASEVHFEETLDMRYRGQSFHIEVPRSETALERFHELHLERFGYSSTDEPVEVVNVRLSARIGTPKPLPPPPAGGDDAVGQRYVLFENGWHRVPVFQRFNLAVGRSVPGPAIVEEAGSTTVVPLQWSLKVDKLGIMHMERA